MNSGRLECELVVLTVLSVLAIFLFPGMPGPYSVVHGPATALQAARAAVRLRIAMARAAMSCPGKCLIPQLAALSWMSLANAEGLSTRLPDHNTILRC
jgi:hypothetical protein